jgi:hypothetical protein
LEAQSIRGASAKGRRSNLSFAQRVSGETRQPFRFLFALLVVCLFGGAQFRRFNNRCCSDLATADHPLQLGFRVNATPAPCWHPGE